MLSQKLSNDAGVPREMTIQPRAAATRRKLIEVSVRLFADNGYQDTTPKDIATAADLTPGAFYYHFKSKEDLADAIIDQGWPDVAALLNDHIGEPGAGLESVIEAVFGVADLINREPLQWVAFHLDMAIGHRNPEARKAYRQRLEGFAAMVPEALRDTEIRAGITRQEAAELLWIALVGSQLMSHAREESRSAAFQRLALTWRSALRSIVPDDAVESLETFVDETASRYTGAAQRGLRQPA